MNGVEKSSNGVTYRIRLTGVYGGTALIDTEDFDRIKFHKWRRHKSGYVVTSVWNKHTKKQELWRLHRFIMDAKEGEFVDHKNHILTDCRKENLRKCNKGENNSNKLISDRNRTGYKGVSIRKGRKKPYMAHIGVRGKSYYLGYYATPQEAGEAYEKASKEKHGEFGTNGIFKKLDKPLTKKKKPRKLLRNDNTSGYTGLNYHKGDNRWIVRLQINGKRIQIGRYKTKSEAIEALREAKKQYETEKK